MCVRLNSLTSIKKYLLHKLANMSKILLTTKKKLLSGKLDLNFFSKMKKQVPDLGS